MLVLPKRYGSVCAIVLIAALFACDDDGTRPKPVLSIACPVAPLNVNAPITLNFTRTVAPGSITGANIVVTNAATGAEIPGSLTFTNSGGGTAVTFSAASALPYQTTVRIRVQNVLSDTTLAPFGLKVCAGVAAGAWLALTADFFTCFLCFFTGAFVVSVEVELAAGFSAGFAGGCAANVKGMRA